MWSVVVVDVDRLLHSESGLGRISKGVFEPVFMLENCPWALCRTRYAWHEARPACGILRLRDIGRRDLHAPRSSGRSVRRLEYPSRG